MSKFDIQKSFKKQSMIIECYPLLKKIQEKPQLYTGGNRLQDICILITGYYYALIEHKIILQPLELDPFFDFVTQQLEYSESNAGWVNMILAVSLDLNPKNINWNEFIALQITNEKHQKSISLFYDLLEKYKNLKSN
ncbi:MAG: hypothetical protein QM535_12050 [Limnohabitans sp.]|nr:hypothetical protein [Limnohabitans sp.]